MAAYTPGSELGYALGVAGSLMMLALLAYPLRKRVAFLRSLGSLPAWFRLHMAFGVLGPLFILAHSRLQVGSLNAAVALACMLLVAGSGLAGRFIYRQIHHGLYGRKATLAELRRELQRQGLERERLGEIAPDLASALAAFRALAEQGGAWRFATLWLEERAVLRLCRREMRVLIAKELRLTRSAAHFETYERLFSLWHVLHIPFVYLFAVAAVIHVIAVHMY